MTNKITKSVEFTLEQFLILSDVLYEIEEYKEYEGEHKTALDELKEMFTYKSYAEFKKQCEL